jgi:ADP-ribose pyrophosphatase YjhB (NUDIX family)
MMSSQQTIVVAVGGAVQREQKLLFVRQTYPPFNQMWSFPTGLPDPGETLDAAVLREIEEETGILARVEGLLAVHHADWPQGPFLWVVFLCTHLAGEPTPDGVENDRTAYLGPTELATLDAARIVPPCAEIAGQIWAGDHHLLPITPLAPKLFGPVQRLFM